MKLFLAQIFCSASMLISPWATLCAQTPAASTPPGAQAVSSKTSDKPESQVAAVKAAERKKRFEEEKTKLENAPPSGQAPGSIPGPNPCPEGETDLQLSPNFVNMPLGESRSFSLNDTRGHKLTSQAEWSVSDSSIADVAMVDGAPLLTTRQLGTVIVTARVAGRSARATVNVRPEEEMAKLGTVIWSAPGLGCSKTSKIVPAVPH